MCDSLGYGTGKYIDIPAFLLIEGNEEYQEWENSKQLRCVCLFIEFPALFNFPVQKFKQAAISK